MKRAAPEPEEDASVLGVVPLRPPLRAAHGLVSIAQGSVVAFEGDATVNAANVGMIGGGGVDGAINRIGGPALKKARWELDIIGADGRRCDTGDARTTTGGSLPATHVIHAVGPNYCELQDTDHGDALLFEAYRSAMREARRHGVRTIGFALLSAGIFRADRPLTDVLRIGLLAVMSNAYPALQV